MTHNFTTTTTTTKDVRSFLFLLGFSRRTQNLHSFVSLILILYFICLQFSSLLFPIFSALRCLCACVKSAARPFSLLAASDCDYEPSFICTCRISCSVSLLVGASFFDGITSPFALKRIILNAKIRI